jgi:tripartite-type tricarboxylate transporter receptor subunit TctC
MRPQFVFAMVALAMGALGASAQDYPTKPVRIIAASAGSSGDFAARLIAQGITGSLGQQVIVENRGGSVTVSGELVAKAPPDGHTLLFMPSSLWLLPFMQDNVPYDPVRDFAPITLSGSTPAILVVHPSLRVNSVKELLALARARPGALNYGSASTGSATHIASELLKSMGGVQIVRIPYKGTAQALNDLLGGQVQLMFSTLAPALPHVKSGRLKGLAVTSAEPSALAPGVPTVAASGLPGFEATSTQGMFAPGKTPAAIVQRLNQETVRFLNRPEIKEKFLSVGTDVHASSPEQFAATIKSEMTRLGKAIRDAGIRAE